MLGEAILVERCVPVARNVTLTATWLTGCLTDLMFIASVDKTKTLLVVHLLAKWYALAMFPFSYVSQTDKRSFTTHTFCNFGFSRFSLATFFSSQPRFKYVADRIEAGQNECR